LARLNIYAIGLLPQAPRQTNRYHLLPPSLPIHTAATALHRMCPFRRKPSTSSSIHRSTPSYLPYLPTPALYPVRVQQLRPSQTDHLVHPLGRGVYPGLPAGMEIGSACQIGISQQLPSALINFQHHQQPSRAG